MIDDFLSFNVLKAQRSIVRYVNSLVKDSGLSVNQFLCLLTLRECAGQNTTLMSLKLGMDRTTLHRNLLPLTAFVYIDKSHDKRCCYPRLTKQGTAILDEWLPKLREADGDAKMMLKDVKAFVGELNNVEQKIGCNALLKKKRSNY